MFQELFMLIAFLVLGFFAVLLILAACSYIKEKLTDRFGHELKNTDKNVRLAFVMKLDDELKLKNVALKDRDIDVRIAALQRIDDEKLLNEVAECKNNYISRLAKMKIQN